jgi:aspartate-semialdehyde dehydrogenase
MTVSQVGSTPDRIPVGILGATGAVGQKFVELLEGHPWFEVTVLAASGRSEGKLYRDAVNWFSDVSLPEYAAGINVCSINDEFECRILFSALPADIADTVERDLANRGHIVVSNARSNRLENDVPLIIPEVNADHLRLVEEQASFKNEGFVVTNPNCATVGLCCALKPIHDAFGIDAVQVTSLQALSGAGHPGVPALDSLGNIIPFIEGEEQKLSTEPAKLLGTIHAGHVEPAQLTISAQCNRVPVIDGHLLCVSIKLSDRSIGTEGTIVEKVRGVLESYAAPQEVQSLPSTPKTFIRVFDDDTSPQPRKHVGLGDGMTVSIGRLRACEVLDIKFVVLVHNTVRGAAGCAIQNAELVTSALSDVVGR